MLPPDLQGLLGAIDAVEADATSLVRGLTDAQGNWQPDGGTGWSIAQCLDHMAKTNHFYVGHFLPVVERAYSNQRRPFTGLSPSWFGRKFVSILEPPVTFKVKAPGTIQPRSAIPLADALLAFQESHWPYRRMVELASHVDVNRLRAPNPFLKVARVRLSTALLVTPAHDRRHLWQARRVLDAPGFPQA